MANRRSNSSSKSNTETVTEAVTPTEEAPVSTETTEPTKAPTSESTETEAAKPAEAPVDLTAFQAALDAAVAEADETTGDIPLAVLDGVTKAFRDLPNTKSRNAAKRVVDEAMKDAMNSDNLPGARSYLQVSDKALVGGGTKSSEPKAPANPTESYILKVGTLRLAYSVVVGNVPDGVDEDWSDKLEALVAEESASLAALVAWNEADPETRGDEPEASGMVRNAVKLASGKAAKAGTVRKTASTYEGERRNIANHIESAFADKELGTFLTVAEIRKARSEEYGESEPSAGAINARLFPKSGESAMVALGIVPEIRGGKKGAVKVAVDEA